MQKLKVLPTLWAVIMVILSLTLVGIPYVHGTTWYVMTDGSDTNGGTGWEDSFKTIQRGIDEASAGDTVLVADGTYTGDENKNISLGYKNMIVRSVNGPQSCIIDLQNDGKGFDLNWTNTTATLIDGFTIMNGNPGATPLLPPLRVSISPTRTSKVEMRGQVTLKLIPNSLMLKTGISVFLQSHFASMPGVTIRRA
jgi:hypothetical protein